MGDIDLNKIIKKNLEANQNKNTSTGHKVNLKPPKTTEYINSPKPKFKTADIVFENTLGYHLNTDE